MKVKYTLIHCISIILNNFASLLYQNMFTVDSFRYSENEDDIEVTYSVTGKRSPVFRKKLSQIVKDEKMLDCFSRKDICEMGVFYGRIVEKGHQKKIIKHLELALSEFNREIP